MELFKKSSRFMVIILTMLISNTHTSEQSPATTWVSLVGSTLLNGYTGFKKFLSYVTTPDSFPFNQLPVDIQTEIIKSLASSCTPLSLQESAQTINALAQTNKLLNILINDPEFNLKLIKNRAKQFNVSDVKVAQALQTKAAKVQLKIQLALAKIMKELVEEQENDNALERLNTLLEKEFKLDGKVYKVDLDFTYRWDKESQEYLSPLMYAVQADNKFLINYLLEHGANINQAGFNGKTALMYADNPSIITLLIKRSDLNINQQDNGGSTVLLRAIQQYFPEDEEQKENNIAIIKQLLDADANPEIANNDEHTPLQAAAATGDQNVIDLVQNAINKNIINKKEQ